TVQQQGNNLILYFGTPLLAGDYDGNGIVDSRDYVVWREALANNGTLQNETASPGVVDQADYDAWRANFGATAGAGSGASATGAVIPEPATVSAFAILAAALLLCFRQRTKRDFAHCGFPELFCNNS